MACGTAIGGWKIIKTVGGKIFKLQPVTGFAADLKLFHRYFFQRLYYPCQ